MSAGTATRPGSEGHFTLLLVSLLLLMVSLPVAEAYPAANLITIFAFWVVLFAGVVGVTSDPRIRRRAILLAVPAVLTDVELLLPFDPYLSAASQLTNALFLGFVGVVLLRHILDREDVTTDVILGGVCVYLMLGIFFASIYRAIEVLSPGSFLVHGEQLPVAAPEGVHMLYYSFVTLTTLGYGEIVPMSSMARILAVVEAMAGSLYVAILIASLVAIRISSGGRESP